MADRIDTAALRELLAKALPGPWSDCGSGFVGAPGLDWPILNGELNSVRAVVALHNAAPALLDEVERLRRIEDAVREEREARRAVAGLGALSYGTDRHVEAIERLDAACKALESALEETR